MNNRFGNPRNLSGPSGLGGFPGPTLNMIVIMIRRLSQITEVSTSNGTSADVWVPSASDKSSTARIWHGTPIKKDRPCIFPENDISFGGVETGSIGKRAAMASPTAANNRKAKPMRLRSDRACATTAVNRHVLATANAEKHSAITQPCRPSAY